MLFHLLGSSIGSSGIDTNCTASDCISCTQASYTSCAWCISEGIGRCFSLDKEDMCIRKSRYPDTCPIDWPKLPVDFLEHWMGKTINIIGDLALLDISLAGTHDTLTHDLSLRTSLGGIDGADTLAEILHNYSAIVPNGIEDYIRQQAQTQAVSIVDQLNNGVRFFDIRIMFEYSDVNPNWYSIHFVQSNSPAILYLQQIKFWMELHPSEIIVLWLSKHGRY